MIENGPESKFNAVLPIVIGLIMGGLIVFGHPYLKYVGNTFTQNWIIVLVMLCAFTSAILLRNSPKLVREEIELWQELRKEGRTSFILRETFSNAYILFAASFGLGGILLLRDYLKGSSMFDNISFYLLPTLLILLVQLITSIQSWRQFERAYAKRGEKKNSTEAQLVR